MNANEKLIRFMELKQEVLKSLGCNTPYFTKGDAEIIQAWSKEDAKEIWDILEDSIKLFDGKGLRSDVCPFCIYHSVKGIPCQYCKYAKNHGGICSFRSSSDYNVIIVFLETKFGKDADKLIFSNTLYKFFLDLIEYDAKCLIKLIENDDRKSLQVTIFNKDSAKGFVFSIQ